MTRVLVTGGTGFIGSRCVPLLVQLGFDVHATHSPRGPHPAAPDGVVWHEADLLAGGAVEIVARVRPTHLLHLAWYAEPGRFWSSPENFRWVAASLELFRAFVDSGGRRAVAAGSCAEYDWTTAETPLPESASLLPASVYGIAKRALAALLAAHATLEGVSFAWGRVFHLYGPGEDPRRLIAGTVQTLMRGDVARCSSGEQRRDFLHVDDVAAAFVRLLDSNVEGEVNIASGIPVSVRDVVQSIARQLDRESLLALGALAQQPGEPPFLVADVARLRHEVGWSPAFDLESGLGNTIAWWASALGDETARPSPSGDDGDNK